MLQILKKFSRHSTYALTLICCSPGIRSVKAQAVYPIQIKTNNEQAKINPAMWGIFFEDINFAADGGLYAELVKNRSFEFGSPKMGWTESGNGKVLIVNRSATDPANQHYATVTVRDTFALTNEGFRGMGIQAGKKYDLSLSVQNEGKPFKAMARLLSSDGKTLAQVPFNLTIGNEWHQVTATLVANATAEKARLQIVFNGNGSLNVDMISLFPQDTWKNRPGGLRKDLVEKLAALKPGFIRFPGGCIVEGTTLDRRYQWKKTVGDIAAREVLINRWNTEFPSRSAPDYYQSFGLGFYEYFLLSEDLKAKPLPILNCGMACQYNTAEVAGMNQLDPYIQDALDLIEFANGDVSTPWGKVRARMGHPAPFGLDRIGIGNEQWDEQYLERYKAFEKVLKKRYPQMKLVAAAGPSPKGKEFDFAWQHLPQTQVDLLDEHYYQSPEWFFANAKRYDNYNRKGPKVFAGEYAAHDKEGKEAESRNTWLSALAEAAFMTGLERNADVVQMAAYAPLFAHVEAWQWRPDLIWFDNLRSVATPNYYVQQLFSTNKGDVVVPALLNGTVLAGGPDSLYASAAVNKQENKVIIKIVNIARKSSACDVSLDAKLPKQAELTTLSATTDMAMNTLGAPAVVTPVHSSLKTHKGGIKVVLKPRSVNVITIKLK